MDSRARFYNALFLTSACTVLVLAAATIASGCGDRTENDPRRSIILGATLDSGELDGAELATIEEYLSENYYASSDIQYSFETAQGEQIDCIALNSLHSVKARLAQGKSIPTPPASPPLLAGSTPSPNVPPHLLFNGELDQNGNPRKCPAQTVPTMRPTAAAILAAGGVEAFQLRLTIQPPPRSGGQSSSENDCWLNDAGLPGNGCLPYGQGGAAGCINFDHAVGIQKSGWLPSGSTGCRGIYSVMPIYAPSVVGSIEHADSQFWLQTGNCENWYNALNGAPSGQQCATGKNCTSSSCAVQSLETGWINGYVPYTSCSNTGNSCFFVFFTSDGYLGGCWANGGGSCYGGADPWIPAEGAPLVAGQILPTSAYGEEPYEIGLQVWNGDGGWWLWVDGTLAGVYATDVFDWPSGSMDAGTAGPMVNGPATYSQFGGEVANQWNSGYHTTTDMVSPYLAEEGYKYAAYQRNALYIDSDAGYHDASLSFYTAPSWEGDDGVAGLCGLFSGGWYDGPIFIGNYDLSTTLDAGGSGWGTYFYMGGGPWPP